ncbi:MAG: tyrosine-type recombinase/integrase [Xanthobacteraceae bacterium]|jgi:hypothetical protein
MSIEQQKAKSERPEIRSLPIEEWPSAERIAWVTACRQGVRLKGGGAASHFRRVTQHTLAQKNGLFLDFVARSKRLDPHAEPGAHVTPDLVEPFVEELKQRVGSVTVYGSIQKLKRITQLIAPEQDVAWLMEIERELFSQMQPKSKWARVVLTELIVEAGLTHIAEAETAEKLTKLTRARMVRNGLMQTLQAACPIRIKNFAALEIGHSIVKQDSTWWIILTADETKEKRADERPIEDYIGKAIDKYVETYRPILGRGKNTTNALWLAETGEAMSAAYVGELITETARLTLGVPVNPHMFRTAAATTAAVHAGDTPHLGSAILHHWHPLENYNRASSISAGRALREVIQRFRDK